MFKALLEELNWRVHEVQLKTLVVSHIAISIPLPLELVESGKEYSTWSRQDLGWWLLGQHVKDFKCQVRLAILSELHDCHLDGIKVGVIARFSDETKLYERG